MDLEKIFSKKESKKILKIALDRKYAIEKHQQEGSSLEELKGIAESAGIDDEHLKYAIEKRKNQREKIGHYLGGTIGALTMLSIFLGVGYIVTPKESEYIQATVVKEIDETKSGNGCRLEGSYGINFKLKNDKKNYFAQIKDEGYCDESDNFKALRNALKDGSEIKLKREVLDKMGNEITVSIYSEEIRVVRP